MLIPQLEEIYMEMNMDLPPEIVPEDRDSQIHLKKPSILQMELKREQPGYKEMQALFKEIAKRAMLDKEYRELCLRDSKAAITKIAKCDMAIPHNIVFLEEDGEGFDRDSIAYILPPFLKPSWLTSTPAKG